MAQYKATGVLNNSPAFMQAYGNLVGDDDTATPTAALAVSDTIDLIRIPGGTRLQELFKKNGDFDTGATAQYKLGYRKADPSGQLTDVDNYFGSALTDLQAAVTGAAPTRYDFAPITFNEDVFITLTVTAAAAGVTGTPSITTYYRGIAVGTK